VNYYPKGLEKLINSFIYENQDVNSNIDYWH